MDDEKRMFVREPLPMNRQTGKFLQGNSEIPLQKDRLTLALPTGELEQSVTKFFKTIGLEFPPNDRRYFVQVENLPVDFIFLRASDIPTIVDDENSSVQAGITGSDIIWEQKKSISPLTVDWTEEVPIFDVVDTARPSQLYVGVTSDFAKKIKQEEGRAPVVEDLQGRGIVTKYPNITQDFLKEKGITDVKITRVSGTDEAYQYAYNNRWGFEGILGIINSGKTVKQNDLVVLEKFYDCTVDILKYARPSRWDTQKLSTRDLVILDEIRELTYLALRKKGVIR